MRRSVHLRAARGRDISWVNILAIFCFDFGLHFRFGVNLCVIPLLVLLLMFAVIIVFDLILEASVLDVKELFIVLDLVSPFIPLVERSRNSDGRMPLDVSYQNSNLRLDEAGPDLVGFPGSTSGYYRQLVLVVSSEKGVLGKQVFPGSLLCHDLFGDDGATLEFTLDDGFGRVCDVKRCTHLRVGRSNDRHQVVLVTPVDLMFL